jgi:hypothetical protein
MKDAPSLPARRVSRKPENAQTFHNHFDDITPSGHSLLPQGNASQ